MANRRLAVEGVFTAIIHDFSGRGNRHVFISAIKGAKPIPTDLKGSQRTFQSSRHAALATKRWRQRLLGNLSGRVESRSTPRRNANQ